MSFITDAIKDMMMDGVQWNLSGMFADVNDSLGSIMGNIGRTPETWNGTVFNMVHNLAENVMMPIAGLVLTFILGYEIISMVIDKNNMHDFEVSNIFQYIMKCFIAILIVTNAWSIANAIFALGQYIVEQAGAVIGTSAALDDSTLSNVMTSLDSCGIGGLIMIFLETSLVRLVMNILALVVTLTLYGRMIEMYMYLSIAPIPFSTMVNKEWGQTGRNYLLHLGALALQGFFMLLCFGIYASLVSSAALGAVSDPDSLHSALWGLMGYTVILAMMMRKCGSISQQMLYAH